MPLLMAGAHLDLLTLTRGHLPPLSLRSGPTDGLCPTRKRRLAGSSGGGGPPHRSPTHPPPRGHRAPCPLGVVDLTYFISLFVSSPLLRPSGRAGGLRFPCYWRMGSSLLLLAAGAPGGTTDQRGLSRVLGKAY